MFFLRRWGGLLIILLLVPVIGVLVESAKVVFAPSQDPRKPLSESLQERAGALATSVTCLALAVGLLWGLFSLYAV